MIKKRFIAGIILIIGAFSLTSCKFFDKSYSDENAKVVKVDTSITQVVEKVDKYCVGITCTNSSLGASSLGSGIIFKNDGDVYYVLTNFHVISNFIGKDRSLFKVYVGDNTNSYKAYATTAYNSAKDLAIMQFESKTKLDVYTIDKLKLPIVTKGESVLAIGCPLSLDFYNSVCEGIVSREEYEARYSYTTSTGSTSYSTISVIQTTCPINPGNSGGALFNYNGELIGINFKKTTYTTEGSEKIVTDGLNYSIALSEVVTFLTEYALI